MYEYKATVHRIIDGDTVDVTIDLGFEMTTKQRIRLYGINTPETRTRDLEEKKRGKASKARLLELINTGDRQIILQTLKRGKYGRILGKLLHPETRENYNRTLLKEGHAVKMIF
jgi:micrococcal nuclease|tara:strand:+ start:601 stop:942 length:342 start_codon:yes stop_codon:yes gene_type:complete